MDFLAYAWAGIIAFCVLMYVILDGFTLGTGVMMSFMDRDERNIAMSVILPTWDGNQTWLVLGMASLYGAFPLAFSTLLPILYMPLTFMVIFLLLRGVVFEFRLKAHLGMRRWDILFVCSSILVALIQGVILANVIQGFDNRPFELNWFSVLVSLVVLFGYCLLGSTRLILKTTGKLQSKMNSISNYLAVSLFVLLMAVSCASLWVHPEIARLWLNPAFWTMLYIFPFLTLTSFIALLLALGCENDVIPYWSSVVIFICCYAGFGLDIYPYIVPYSITIVQAASPKSSLEFIFVGACIMLPVLLVYTGYSYRIFRGKVNETIHY